MKNFSLVVLLICHFCLFGQEKQPFVIAVSPTGKDINTNGSVKEPVKTVEFAIQKAKNSQSQNLEILLLKGTHYLAKTIVINSDDFKNKKVSILGKDAVVSAGRKIELKWKKYNNNIWQADLDVDSFEQLYVNGKPQILARYPNYDATARIFNGTAADALEKVKSWKNPKGVYVHGLHIGEWGSFHYQVKGIKNNEIEWEGGWQNNRPSPLHKTYRFVENAFEALDSPNEWFYDKQNKTLYFYPTPNLNLEKALVEVSHLRHSIELKGTIQNPVQNITLQNLTFTHNERTFMNIYEPLLRSDWRIYRGGAVVLENTENCLISDCEFVNLGGNAVFFSRYNKNSTVKGSIFHEIGASAICFVGDTSAVRSASFQYDFFVPLKQLDIVAGPKNEQYPRKCTATDNLIFRIGRIEKQATGVQIDMSSEIEISHNTIYDVPRAGINIGSGCWGGHIIENNDVFNTVLETGDHGAFNSWGRDRYWHPDRKTMDKIASERPELILLDAQKTVIIRNNRFRCDHGWDIDLDDGSSNFNIYNNVCLNGGLKLREGFYRKVFNNVLINNSFHPHVWFKNSHDEFQHNILQKRYFPIGVDDWGDKIDYNLFPDEAALALAQKNNTDKNSKAGNPQFINAAKGDYRVASNSIALTCGFKNFPMDDFGVKSARLRKMASKPIIPNLSVYEAVKGKSNTFSVLGGEVKSIEGLGERSAYGLPDETGVLVVSVNQNSLLMKSGVLKQDVIRKADDAVVKDAKAFLDIVQSSQWKSAIDIEVFRNQKTVTLKLLLK